VTSKEGTCFRQLIHEYQDIFIFEDNDIGLLDLSIEPPHKIRTVNHEAWNLRPYPMYIPQEIVAIELLRNKIEDQLFEPSHSSYGSRWFLKKKSNGKHRLLIDLRPLNAVTIRDVGIPPLVDRVSESFAGQPIYPTFDLLIPRSYKRDETKVMLTKRPLAPSDLKFDLGRKLLLNGDDARLIKDLERKVNRFEGSYSNQLLMEAVRMKCDPTRHDLSKINCEGEYINFSSKWKRSMIVAILMWILLLTRTWTKFVKARWNLTKSTSVECTRSFMTLLNALALTETWLKEN
jgi:hypothetical protein